MENFQKTKNTVDECSKFLVTLYMKKILFKFNLEYINENPKKKKFSIIGD
jgi:hypothetical protein